MWEADPALLIKKVNAVGFADRSVRCLEGGDIAYVGDLVQRTESELLRMPHLGRHALHDIKVVLAGMGLHLGMYIPEWLPENIEKLARN